MHKKSPRREGRLRQDKFAHRRLGLRKGRFATRAIRRLRRADQSPNQSVAIADHETEPARGFGPGARRARAEYRFHGRVCAWYRRAIRKDRSWQAPTRARQRLK